MKTVNIYGLPNCDSTQKALKWLKSRAIPVQFHDYKTEGIDADTLADWCKKIGWQALLNKKSTTWRSLPDDIKAAVVDEKTAIETMMSHNSLIKRPVVVAGKKLLVGYNETDYSTQLK